MKSCECSYYGCFDGMLVCIDIGRMDLVEWKHERYEEGEDEDEDEDEDVSSHVHKQYHLLCD